MEILALALGSTRDNRQMVQWDCALVIAIVMYAAIVVVVVVVEGEFLMIDRDLL